MKRVFVPATLASLALLLVVGLVSLGNAAPASRMSEGPDFTINFYGLMVFAEPHDDMQLIRLHSEAPGHLAHIRISGPGYDHGYEWSIAYPKNAALDFSILGNGGISPNRARFSGTKPYNFAKLHEGLSLLMDEDAFGPSFTFHAGDFAEHGNAKVDFINKGVTTTETVSTMVQATITLKADEIGGFLTGKVPGHDPLPEVFLVKPTGSTKWTIDVSVEPDLGHICGYHFKHYYQGIKFKNAQGKPESVPTPLQYIAKKNGVGDSPCGDEGLTLKEMIQDKDKKPRKTREQNAIETRPCIPISF
jgi:hypothetical protein